MNGRAVTWGDLLGRPRPGTGLPPVGGAGGGAMIRGPARAAPAPMPVLAPESVWYAHAPAAPDAAPPADDLRCGVCVVGAGLTGLTLALELARGGEDVVVLEANAVGGGTTGGTSGMLDASPDRGADDFLSRYGERTARTVTAGRTAAIETIERLCGEVRAATGIDCDFRRVPAYVFTESPDRRDALRERADATGRLGLDVAWVGPAVPMPFAAAGGFRVDGMARVDALRLAVGLARLFTDAGGRLFTGTRAMLPQPGSPVELPTQVGGGQDGPTVRADRLVLATHCATLGPSEFDARLAAYNSYCLTAPAGDPPDDALFWDDADPYHYFRRGGAAEPGAVLVGGADHKTGQGNPSAQADLLLAYARDRFSIGPPTHRWGAELFEPADRLPLVGPAPLRENVFVAAGFSGTGLTYGVAAATLLADTLRGRANPLADPFDPRRANVTAGARDFVAENLNVAKQYAGMAFEGRPLSDPAAVPPGTGLLGEAGGETVAWYRDEAGTLHALDPHCTHAGCVVHWNDAAKTWDCPCHGGRFTPTGTRLYGPPHGDLDRAGAS